MGRKPKEIQGNSNAERVSIVWFKRDLRAHDHRALAAAAQAGPVLPLYIVEPALWAEPDMAGRHWRFIADCLEELREDLAGLGQPLVVRVGEVIPVLEALCEALPVGGLWSHEETGNGWTFARDRAVARWARARGLAWTEIPQHGVIRGLTNRNGWAGKWDRLMGEPQTPAPPLKPLTGVEPGPIPTAEALGLAPDPCPGRQIGGRSRGLSLLATFLEERGETYRADMSSPVTGFEACSRLSPYFAWGALSMREAAQATWMRQAELKGVRSDTARNFRDSLKSFSGRLHWHCHFMQKLENEPRIEFENFHRGCDGLRENDFSQERFEAWAAGQTGYPFVDACMRALRETGWMNFRMRAMLMSFSSYHLWLHWREPALELARLFTDYEPGIHYSQSQMQSGTTGINTIRIYSPIKQSTDQDPTGNFIRRYVPELSALEDKRVHTPWKLTPLEQQDLGIVIGKDYPAPIVDHATAVKEAKDRIYTARRQAGFREEADAIQNRHGSRKSGMPQTGQRGARRATGRSGAGRKKADSKEQMALDLPASE